MKNIKTIKMLSVLCGTLICTLNNVSALSLNNLLAMQNRMQMKNDLVAKNKVLPKNNLAPINKNSTENKVEKVAQHNNFSKYKPFLEKIDMKNLPKKTTLQLDHIYQRKKILPNNVTNVNDKKTKPGNILSILLKIKMQKEKLKQCAIKQPEKEEIAEISTDNTEKNSRTSSTKKNENKIHNIDKNSLFNLDLEPITKVNETYDDDLCFLDLNSQLNYQNNSHKKSHEEKNYYNDNFNVPQEQTVRDNYTENSYLNLRENDPYFEEENYYISQLVKENRQLYFYVINDPDYLNESRRLYVLLHRNQITLQKYTENLFKAYIDTVYNKFFAKDYANCDLEMDYSNFKDFEISAEVYDQNKLRFRNTEDCYENLEKIINIFRTGNLRYMRIKEQRIFSLFLFVREYVMRNNSNNNYLSNNKKIVWKQNIPQNNYLSMRKNINENKNLNMNRNVPRTTATGEQKNRLTINQLLQTLLNRQEKNSRKTK